MSGLGVLPDEQVMKKGAKFRINFFSTLPSVLTIFLPIFSAYVAKCSAVSIIMDTCALYLSSLVSVYLTFL